jgi:hypothetical protein
MGLNTHSLFLWTTIKINKKRLKSIEYLYNNSMSYLKGKKNNVI